MIESLSSISPKNQLQERNKRELSSTYSQVVANMKQEVDTSNQKKPHAIFIPYPAQGHITPLLKLSKLLHSKGFYVTFVNTHHNHRRLLKSQGLAALNSLPSFNFESIPDGLPPSDPDATQHIPTLSSSVNTNCHQPFMDLVTRINNQSVSNEHGTIPPVSLVVADFSMNFTYEVSRELGIPLAVFWTASACALLGYFQYRRLVDMGIVPLKDPTYLTNGYLDKEIDWIPGMEGIRLRNLPSFLRTTDINDPMFNIFIGRVEKALLYSAPIIINTYDALEHDVLKHITTFSPPIYTIGPLDLLLEQKPTHEDSTITTTTTSSFRSNLWSEDPHCLQWLESKKPNSVLYINFGSITVLDRTKVIELAWGLANSKSNFLWIIRPDLISGGDSHHQDSFALPPDLLEEVEGRGLFAKWCNQEKVLQHPATGGFLTHCGWNSTLESLSNGIAMICFPFFADQMTNCWFCCNKWGVGIELEEDKSSGKVERDEVKRVVRELMEGEKGKMMKDKALKWKELAEEASVNADGSSSLNLDKLINQVLH